MHDQRLSIVEIGDEIFRAAAQIENASALKARSEALGKGKAQIATAEFDARDRRADQRGREAPPHGFDFGQLRHM